MKKLKICSTNGIYILDTCEYEHQTKKTLQTPLNLNTNTSRYPRSNILGKEAPVEVYSGCAVSYTHLLLTFVLCLES